MNVDQVESIEVIHRLEPSQLPWGTWSGLWSDYTVDVVMMGVAYRLKTKMGLRGINIPCLVHVQTDGIRVEVIHR